MNKICDCGIPENNCPRHFASKIKKLLKAARRIRKEFYTDKITDISDLEKALKEFKGEY